MDATVVTFPERLRALPFGEMMEALATMVDNLADGTDEVIAAAGKVFEEVGANAVIVGGAAVIRHGYPRPTQDRDFLIDYHVVGNLADRLEHDPDWERLEIRQYAFRHRSTGIQIDFLVSGDLIQMGRPYLFPSADEVETDSSIENIPVVGLHDLMWLKLLAGRMQDLADIMQLCKIHLGKIDPDRVLRRLQPEDDDLRQTMLEIMRKAPIEIANERRLGQGLHPDYKKKSNES
jgi:hypothetical protein